MKKCLSVVCLGALVCCALLVVAQTGCKAAKSDELPITTKSKEARELFVQGRDQLEFYHVDKAMAFFKEALELDPEFAVAQLFYAVNAVETPDYQAGLAKAASLAKQVSEGEQKLIAGYYAATVENDASKTNQIFQDLAALFPKDKRVHLFLAQTYGGLQKYDEQLAAIETAIALDKTFAPAHEALGYFYRWREKPEKAEAAFKEYARLSPKEANSHDILGDLYMKTGRFEDAIREYEEAVRMDPAFFYSQQKIGSSLYFLGKFEEGRQAFLKAMDMPVRPTAKVYDQEGVMRGYIYEGDHAKALEAADKAIQMGYELGLPEESTFLPLVKGFIHCELGDYEKAEACVADGLRALDSSGLLDSIKEYQRAVADFAQVMIAAGNKDFEAALAHASSLRDRIAALNNPAMQKQAAWAVGYIALAQGDAAKAIGYFGQGEMDDVFIMYQYALAKEKAGDAAGAAELYRKVANWNIDGAWYAFVRGKAAAKL
jgi:tetratricopeptide (TPR) repeat protein